MGPTYSCCLLQLNEIGLSCYDFYAAHCLGTNVDFVTILRTTDTQAINDDALKLWIWRFQQSVFSSFQSRTLFFDPYPALIVLHKTDLETVQ